MRSRVLEIWVGGGLHLKFNYQGSFLTILPFLNEFEDLFAFKKVVPNTNHQGRQSDKKRASSRHGT